MRRAYLVLTGSFLAAVTLAVTVAAQQPRITNARLTAQPAGTPFVQSFRSLVSSQTDVVWIGYTVPVVNGDRIMCCFTSGSSFISGSVVMSDSGDWQAAVCGLEPGATDRSSTRRPGAPQGPVKLEGSQQMNVLFRVSERSVERVRSFSEECELDAGGRPVIWLQNVRPSDSLALLESLLGSEAEPQDRSKSRVINSAIHAIAMHAEPAADALLERLARRHASTTVRGESLFWIAQRDARGGEQVVLQALEKDPSVAVRKKAVFALSQFKSDRGVPPLIQAARSHADAAVRGEAIFWLGQKAGAKAAAAITEMIENDPDTEVKKRAVFALSQMPKDEGVPLLIKVARTHNNPAVRKQAIFWLGQSKDPRAIDFFAEILK